MVLPLLFADTTTETVTVVVTSDEPATLEMDDGTGYRDVCATPCRQEVPPSAFVRLAGRGVVPSPGVRIDGDVTLRGNVRGRTARAAQTVGGVGLLGVGMVSLGGAFLLAVQNIHIGPFFCDAQCEARERKKQEEREMRANVATALALGGIVSTVTGIVILFANRASSQLGPESTPERSWRLVPTASATSGGAALEARF